MFLDHLVDLYVGAENRFLKGTSPIQKQQREVVVTHWKFS
jgi:hypothetical protein